MMPCTPSRLVHAGPDNEASSDWFLVAHSVRRLDRAQAVLSPTAGGFEFDQREGPLKPPPPCLTPSGPARVELGRSKRPVPTRPLHSPNSHQVEGLAANRIDHRWGLEVDIRKQVVQVFNRPPIAHLVAIAPEPVFEERGGREFARPEDEHAIPEEVPRSLHVDCVAELTIKDSLDLGGVRTVVVEDPSEARCLHATAADVQQVHEVEELHQSRLGGDALLLPDAPREVPDEVVLNRHAREGLVARSRSPILFGCRLRRGGARPTGWSGCSTPARRAAPGYGRDSLAGPADGPSNDDAFRVQRAKS